MISEALLLWFGFSETQRGRFEFIESKRYDRTFSNKFVVLGEADECIVFIDLLSVQQLQPFCSEPMCNVSTKCARSHIAAALFCNLRPDGPGSGAASVDGL